MKSKIKSVLSFVLTACIITSLCACSSKDVKPESESQDTVAELNPIFSADDVTVENIVSLTTPKNIVDNKGAFSVSKLYKNTGDALLEGSVSKTAFGKNGSDYEISEEMKYSDGYVTTYYFSTDSEDNNMYVTSTGGNSVDKLEDGYANDICTNSVLYYSPETTTVSSVNEDENSITVELTVESSQSSNDKVTIDKKTGLVTSVVSVYDSAKSKEKSTCTYTFDYSDDIKVDVSPKIANGGKIEEKTTNAATDSVKAGITFSSVDVSGNKITSDVMSGAKLVLLNFWEPWCGPCVKEMPDLQKLYEKYKDKGLVIIGVYSTQDNAERIVEEKGVKYPIVLCDDNLSALAQDYVPATYLIDGNGNLIDNEPIDGAKSYDEWEAIILEHLN